jgi:hypothetical protein
MTGIELIAIERSRQVSQEGFDDHHDDCNYWSELAIAAASYALPESVVYNDGSEWFSDRDELWPFKSEWFKTGDRIRELSKAGALIAAEIDRLQRLNDI